MVSRINRGGGDFPQIFWTASSETVDNENGTGYRLLLSVCLCYMMVAASYSIRCEPYFVLCRRHK